MKRLLLSGAAAFLLLAQAPSSGWGQQFYLYAPRAVDAPLEFPGKDGVVVREVTVQKGDTLYGLSRKFSGCGSFYPQILLFNEIKDPNLIYPGEVFRVPVSKKGPVATEPAPAAEPKPVSPAQPAASEAKKVEAVPVKKHSGKDKPAAPVRKAAAETRQATAPKTTAGQLLFENAVRAYRQDDCATALDLFDRYLRENQGSALAADASFYKAECYLKMSK